MYIYFKDIGQISEPSIAHRGGFWRLKLSKNLLWQGMAHHAEKLSMNVCRCSTHFVGTKWHFQPINLEVNDLKMWPWTSQNTLPETNSSHLKMDGWNTILFFWGPAYFQGRAVSFRECIKLVTHENRPNPPKFQRIVVPQLPSLPFGWICTKVEFHGSNIYLTTSYIYIYPLKTNITAENHHC